MTTQNSFFPAVDHRFQFVFAFVSLNDNFVLIQHGTLDCEEILQVFGGEGIKGVSVIFHLGVFLLLCLLYLELFLNIHFLGLTFLTFLFFGILLLLFLLLGDFGLLEPFLDQIALLKGDQSMFVVLDLEGYSISFLLGSLRFGDKVADMFVESVYLRFIFYQDLNGLFSLEFDGFAGWYFGTHIVDIFGLFFGVE